MAFERRFFPKIKGKVLSVLIPEYHEAPAADPGDRRWGKFIDTHVTLSRKQRTMSTNRGWCPVHVSCANTVTSGSRS